MDPTTIKAVPLPAMVAKRAGNQAITAIAIFKLAKAALCLAAAIGLFSVLHHDTQDEARKLLRVFRISGDRHFAKEILIKADLITLPKKKLITALLTFSGLMFTVEGTGLLLKKSWAEYFTILLTSAGIPLELREIFRHATGLAFAALIVNLLIVWYLIFHLMRGWKEKARLKALSHPAQAHPQSMGVG
jgi:uncharacterized membrane protein (DUF2068 family)